MSTIAINPIHRAVRFYEAPIGKKAVMAVTGMLLFGYVIAHLLGNLQIYSGNPDQINAYAAFLHKPENAIPLLVARLVLLLAVGLHIVAAVQLWGQNRAARPVAYKKTSDVPTAYAARTMRWSGVIIAAFVIFHILHLTVNAVPGLEQHHIAEHQPDVYGNVIRGFQNIGVSVFYIVAILLLCMHLYHGIWSMLHSLGVFHPRYTPAIKRGAALVAILIAVGNISIPIAVLTGLVR